MKSSHDTPVLMNGWIVPSITVKYSNTPLIKLSDINSIIYYTNDEFIIKFSIQGSSTLEWNFEYKDEMIYAYKFICDNFLLKDNIYGTFDESNMLFMKP